MGRLPNPGSDDGVWGNLLNEFLSVEHNGDGTLKTTGTLSGYAQDANAVHASGNETVAGIKTFSSSPIVPAPTGTTDAANKAYVDAMVSSGTPDADATTKGKLRLAGDLGGTADVPTVPGLANKQPLDTTLTALASYNTNGLLVQTSADAFTGRTITGTANQASIANGDGVAGNPTISLPQDIHSGASPTFAALNLSSGFAVSAGGTVTMPDAANITIGTTTGTKIGTATTQKLGFFNATPIAQPSGDIFTALGNLGLVSAPTLNATDIGLGSDDAPTFAGLTVNGELTQAIQSDTNWSSGLKVTKRGATGDATAAVAAGSEIGYHQFLAWDGSAFGRAAYAVVNATENFAVGAHGARYAIFTTAIGQADATERLRINETGIMIGGADPTHTLTLPYNGTGIAIYNTGDQTTNYERGRLAFTSNELVLATETGGTGTARNLKFSSAGELRIQGGAGSPIYIANDTSATSVEFFVGSSSNSTGNLFLVGGTFDAAAGVQPIVNLTPAINQSGTAGYSALVINPTETTTGSGTKLLLDAQVGGTSKFKVDNTGQATMGSGRIAITDVTTQAWRIDLPAGDRTGTGAPDTFAMYWDGSRTGYFNEYGELRVIASADNHVALRVKQKSGTHTANLIEATDISNGILFAVSSNGTVTAPNVDRKVSYGASQPSSPSVGDLWIVP